MQDKVIKQWNHAAEKYLQSQENSEFVLINKQVVCDRFKDLSNKKVLDLGCGYGWYSDYFSSIGGDVTGCDGSDKMISIARSLSPNCKYEVVNIEKQLPYFDNDFDMVFCNQVLMDIENIQDLLKEVYRILKPNGIFYFSIVHPAFYDSRWEEDETGFRKNKIVTRYLSEYSFINEFWGETLHFHRTISSYINSAIANSFCLKNWTSRLPMTE